MQRLETFRSETVSHHGPHCGFSELVTLRQQMQQMSPAIQSLAKTILFAPAPERQDSVLSPQGRFMLHFDRTGYHAVPQEDAQGNGIPDYIDSAAVYLDHVWDVEINQLGFKAPPDRNGQPVEVYPIYFTSFVYYGLTTWIEPDISQLPGLNYPSYIEIHNDFAGFDSPGLKGLKVTCAHEFNHAIQLGYNFRLESDLFFMEMTSTWLEDYVYDEVNDYLFYLDDLFRNIFRTAFTKDTGLYPYANSLFLHMLEKLHGPQIVPEIWDDVLSEKAFDAIQSVLQDYGSSFAESQNLYAGWLYFTGSRAIPDTYFPEGGLYPQIEIDTGLESFEDEVIALGMRLIGVEPEYNQLVGATVSGGSGSGVFSHILNESQLLNPLYFGGRQILNVNKNEPVVVVLSNPTDKGINNMEYFMQPQSVVAGPNPSIVRSGNAFTKFRNLPPLSSVYIFNLNGIFVNKIEESVADEAVWDMKDHYGTQVASGIYIYHIKANGFEKLGKITVVR